MYSQFDNAILHAQAPRPTLNRIPTGTYIVKSSMDLGIFLERTDDFVLPEKIYGSSSEKGKRFFETFKSRKRSTGVLLAGEKGSGKTLLATDICVRALREDIPVVIINSPWAGDGFFTFLNKIDQDLVIMIDEYEKIYKEDPNALLTILDGVFQKKRMWLMTTNDVRISGFMLNRPGRIFYKVEYNALDHDVIDQYVKENLISEENQLSAITFLKSSSGMNFDCMKAMVEEMNRYGETAAQVAELLNIPSFKPDSHSEFRLFLDEKEITTESTRIVASNTLYFNDGDEKVDELIQRIFPEFDEKENYVGNISVGTDTLTSFSPQTFERKGKVTAYLFKGNEVINQKEISYSAKPYYKKVTRFDWGNDMGSWL